MSDEQKATENEVFNQELSMDDLDAVSGGIIDMIVGGLIEAGETIIGGTQDIYTKGCTNRDTRQIYGGNGFPNCAATVEDGSWCYSNDACYNDAVDYKGMTDCSKAWE